MPLKRVLVCDDEPNILESMSYVVNKLGHGVEVAENGEEALLRARSYRPDVMILDVRMPKLSGHQVCSALKADPATRHIHIIILTAFGQKSDEGLAFAAGANEFLTKPFSPRFFKTKLLDLLGAVESPA